MAFTTGTTMIIAAPAVVKMCAAGGSPVTVGEIGEDGAKLKVTPEEIQTPLQDGKKVHLVGYDMELNFDIANLSAANLTAIEGFHNEEIDVTIEQTVEGFTSARSLAITSAYLSPSADTGFGKKDASKLSCKVSKAGRNLSDLFTLTDPANA